MVNEGLQEVLHTAARGENVTCVMLNNGVFGETGGHMTSTTVLGQRTKTSLEGRDPVAHGRPILLATLLAQLDGAAYVARGAVNSAGNVARTKKMLLQALRTQTAGAGFSFVEILTMCPTGWFIETQDAPEYLAENLATIHTGGVLKDVLGDAGPDGRGRDTRTGLARVVLGHDPPRRHFPRTTGGGLRRRVRRHLPVGARLRPGSERRPR